METLFCHIVKGGSVAVRAEKGSEAAARVLRRILAERGIGIADDAALRVCLSLCSFGEEESFSIESIENGEKQIKITAPTKRGLLFGVGAWLRGLRYHKDGSLDIPPIFLQAKPKMPWRAALTCYHNQDNGYKYWDVDRERLYMEDLALWGAGLAMFSPLNMWQRNSKTLVDGTPENAAWCTMSSMPSVADELGLKYGMLHVPNDIFKDDLTHCKQSVAGAGEMLFAETACACPSDPHTWDTLLQRREEFFSKMAKVDFMYIHPSDYGGCSCSACGPYIPTYLKLAKAVAACLRRYHPQAKVYIGTVLITEEGMRQYVIPYMQSEQSEWLDGIVYGMHGTAVSLSELADAIPKRFEILLYPEITMAENWGRLGASPWVKHFSYSLAKTQDMAKECIRLNKWPNTSERMFGEQYPPSFVPEEAKDKIHGFFAYSEGLHDEIAKIVWLRYAWDPNIAPEDALMEYCSFYYGDEAAPYVKEAALLMEEITYGRVSKLYCPPLTFADDGNGLSRAEKVVALLARAEEKMPAWAKESWRYLILALRAKLDLLAFQRKSAEDGFAERERILDLAEAIYQKGCHICILPAGLNWDREKAAVYLDKLLTVTEGRVVAPVSPVASY